MLYLFGGIILFVIFDSIRGYRTTKNKKKYLTQLFIWLPIIIVILFLFGPLFVLSPIKLGYNAIKKDNVTVYYPSSKQVMISNIFDSIGVARRDNFAFYKTSFPTPIVIALSELDMLRFGSNPRGGGSGNQLVINIRAQRATSNLIAHEMSHRYLAMVVGKSAPAFPRWFDEGLASYLGKMDYYKKPEELKTDLSTGRYRDDLLKMNGLTGILRWQLMTLRNDSPGSYYGQSYQMIKYLFDQFGENRVYQFVLSLKTNKFSDSFQRVFGMTEDQFHQQFVDYIKNYQPANRPLSSP